MKRSLSVLLVLILLLFAAGCGKREKAPNPQLLVSESVVSISDIFSYSGKFPEDGSDREVQNICAIKLKNNTSADWQYLSICATTDSGEKLYFDATTLLNYGEMTVYEKNATPYKEGMKIVKKEILKSAEFSEYPSVHPELFDFTTIESVINIRNKTTADINKTIYVYYKTFDGENFNGGITYRMKIEGGIKSGETKQISPSHFNAKTSKVVFVTYA